jgi:hypothetical protein
MFPSLVLIGPFPDVTTNELASYMTRRLVGITITYVPATAGSKCRPQLRRRRLEIDTKPPPEVRWTAPLSERQPCFCRGAEKMQLRKERGTATMYVYGFAAYPRSAVVLAAATYVLTRIRVDPAPMPVAVV